MLTLLRKDLIFNRRPLLVAYAFWSVLWLYMPLRDSAEDFSMGVWTGLVSVACAFLPIIMAIREDRYKAGALMCSLPVTRRAIVSAKYVGGWIVALTAAGVAVAAMLLLSWLGVHRIDWPLGRLPFVVFSVLGLVLGLMLPFALRFGVAGVLIALVSLQLLGIAVLLTVSMLGGNPLRGAFSAVVSAVLGVRAGLGDTGFGLVAMAGVALLNIASWRLSILVYAKREF
jgi:ABC-2 type transport system permease protein